MTSHRLLSKISYVINYNSGAPEICFIRQCYVRQDLDQKLRTTASTKIVVYLRHAPVRCTTFLFVIELLRCIYHPFVL